MEAAAWMRPNGAALTLAALCWAALLLAAQTEASQAPVVRPTIFSDLNQPPQEGALPQQAQVSQQQQQQQQQRQQKHRQGARKREERPS